MNYKYNVGDTVKYTLRFWSRNDYQNVIDTGIIRSRSQHRGYPSYVIRRTASISMVGIGNNYEIMESSVIAIMESSIIAIMDMTRPDYNFERQLDEDL